MTFKKGGGALRAAYLLDILPTWIIYVTGMPDDGQIPKHVVCV